ncbi:N-terminal double-transmembrane domain-containing protein [Salinimicrobium catena]|uniref:N-terminal double-transmembrane domain-containing protein n=1 Tax=Salinimicrobium catena TaxID=390640 RepID=A0A1H5LVP2_9FLAO|nr:BatA domain-containing protein [Salinimicrobium catena]SDL15181.1 N-terminal double-transmembrane domain-containing protein [Salinimicrobium catena]SEE81165.1 N-terminal double-transmembrane domain-containing protein [Salinimicrobium catena]
MYFRNPELLYALFLLVIPVLVHLFQLRRFRIEKFTNVKFLKKAVQQTRKSSTIKKWLILFTRLLLLASLIIAFAQPYFGSSAAESESQETVIYLDNSYSMQARGKNGVLLKQGIQQLLENLPQEGEISFFTNSEQFKDISATSLRKKLQEITYSPEQLSWKTISLKAEALLAENGSSAKNFIAISDFQQKAQDDSLSALPSARTFLVPAKPENLNNVAVDSAFVSEKSPDQLTLKVLLKASGKAPEGLPVSLYNGSNLLSRKTANFDEELAAEVDFSIPSGPVENGRISIEDNGLEFDNQLFFSINEPSAIKVVVIGDKNSDFLSRIFTAPEFNLQVFPEENVNYNELSLANLVILNEVRNIPPSLNNQLVQLHGENVFLVVIPSGQADLQSYNSFFREFGLQGFSNIVQQERLITDISFSHPVYASVFDEKVQNFQYPKVQSYFAINRSPGAVLSFETGQPFLIEKDHIFVFSAPINGQNSNFKASPLIVPTFYNIGNLTISLPQLYFSLNEDQKISLQAQLGKDEILKLASPDYSFIPRQQSFQNKVELFLENDPPQPGHYEVLRDTAVLRTLAFNAGRSESQMRYREIKPSKDLLMQQNVPDVFEEIKATGETAALWKWFVIFALILLLTEMLILKFFK